MCRKVKTERGIAVTMNDYSATDDFEPEEPVEQPPAQATQPRAVLGATAAALALVFGAIGLLGVGVASSGDYAFSTVLAQIAIGGTLVTFVSGVVAIILGRGRGWGLAALGLSFIANPLAQIQLLDFFGRFTGA
jgi:hypothetical protein